MVHCTIAQYSLPCLNQPSYTVVVTIITCISHEKGVPQAHPNGRDEKKSCPDVTFSRFRRLY